MPSESTRENPYASPEAFGDVYLMAAAAFGRPGGGAAPIFAEGTINESDYLRAIKLYYRFGWYAARILVLVMVAVYCWFVYVLMRPTFGVAGWRGLFFGRGPLLLIALTAAGLLWTRQDSRVRRGWRNAPLSTEPFSVRITPEVFEVRRESSYSLLRWNCFRGYRMADDLMVLASAYSANQLTVLPKRIFRDEDWERFVALVRERLPRL